MANFVRVLRRATGYVQRFRRDDGGAMALFAGLTSVPIIFAVGAGVDYSSANMAKSRLDAIADAAALSAVDHNAITGTASDAQTTATNVFNAEANNVNNVTLGNVTVTVTDSNTGRTAVVSYTATKTNAFMGLLGIPTTTINGQAQAAAGLSVNINFYLLLDNSPSMNIAATSSGISTMVANTSAQGGCAFACHESNPSADNLGNPNGEDNYTLAANLGVTTRIENMVAATQALTTTATTVGTANNATYRMAVYTFNNSGTSTVQSLTSSLTTVSSAASNIDVLEVYDNNCLTASNCNNDTDTDFNSAMSSINGIMPAPGSGAAGNPPQEVLFLVTDGVDDKVSATCSET